ncbi:MAG: imidazole glycerol phosphate synthase subunit HisH [Clostridia bacterium]|nr:imidazole glycerol phosphate synthase subunit HisH [Clostridia bacterium]
MIAIIDYGVGNLFSLQSSFAMIGQEVTVTSDKTVIQNADRLILPGVGAFGDARKKLAMHGLDETLLAQAKDGKMIMGICLGMQMLFDKSFEYGEHAGLSLIPGEVVDMTPRIREGLKVPHIGWNALDLAKPDHPLFRYIKNGDCVYFVHSYFADKCAADTIATSEYDIPLTAAVAKDNVIGCQFHPEKSGRVGLNLLRAFCEMK